MPAVIQCLRGLGIWKRLARGRRPRTRATRSCAEDRGVTRGSLCRRTKRESASPISAIEIVRKDQHRFRAEPVVDNAVRNANEALPL